MEKFARIEVCGCVSNWELASSNFRERVPIDSAFVVKIGDDHIHGVSTQGQVFWSLFDLERVLKPGNWMRSFEDIAACLAILSNSEPDRNLTYFDSVFLDEMGLLKLFAASISKGRKHEGTPLFERIRSNSVGRLKAAKSLKIDMSPGTGALLDVDNVDKLKLAPAIAKAVAHMQYESGKISDRVQRNVDLYRMLSHVTIRISKAMNMKS